MFLHCEWNVREVLGEISISSVTLVSVEDQFCAHRVVLNSTSPLFKSILMKQNNQLSAKVGIKRKIEISGSLPTKDNAARKPKALLKADLIVKHKELQEQFDSLQKENENNVQLLLSHETTISENVEIIKQLLKH